MKAILGDAPAVDVSKSIAKLGSEKFADRENAYVELKRAGGAVLPQLIKAAEAAKDPEVRQRLNQLVGEIKQLNAGRDTLQMAALKTIQQRKYKELLPEVKKLTKHTDRLVAEYARETVAKLEGKPYKRPAPSDADLAADLALIPGDVGTLAQVRPPRSKPGDLFKSIKALAGLGFPGGADIEAQIKKEIIKAAFRLGNIRFESMVMGVSNEVGPRTGYVVFVVRGYYSPESLLRMIREENGRLEKTTIDGVDVWRPDREFAMICPSNNQLIMIGGPRTETLPIAKVVKALKAAPKKPTFSPEVTKLLAKVDRTKTAWMVMRMNDTFREAPPFKPLDWIVGEASQDDKDAISFKFWGEGPDADAIAATMDEGRKELAKGIAQMEKFGAAVPMMAPMIKIMKSIKLENKGTQASVSLKVDDVSSVMMSPMLFLGLAFRGGAAPPAAIEVEAAPPDEAVERVVPPPRKRAVPKKELKKKAAVRGAPAAEIRISEAPAVIEVEKTVVEVEPAIIEATK